MARDQKNFFKWCGQRPEKLSPEDGKRPEKPVSDVARDQKNFVLVMANGQWKNCALVEEKQVS